jgi:hypothetical protein
MTKKKVSRGINNEDLVMDRKKQVLHFDTWHHAHWWQ